MTTHSTASKPSEALRTIELLLLWEGAAGNDRLRGLLDVHFTTASRLLSQYAQLNPVGLQYSHARKRWEASADFSPTLTPGTIEAYLACIEAQRRQPTSILTGTQMDFGKVDRRTFALLHQAITEGQGVDADHVSMRHPAPTHKRFYPHSLVQAGRRWHTRAWIEPAGAFQDLALTRLSALRLVPTPAPEAGQRDHDEAWQTIVDLKLVPHPALTPPQKQVIRDEYFDGSTGRIEPVRAALLPYVVQELRVALDTTTQTPPDYQIAVDRPKDVARWLFESVQ